MTMRRTTVFADAEDLATIKQAAMRLGIAEAELIREAIHRVALAHREWSEPFFSQTFIPQPTSGEDWLEKTEEYELSRQIPE